MSNLLKAEFYKLFHSWYFWGIGLFNLLLSSVLLLDSVGETSNLFFASIRRNRKYHEKTHFRVPKDIGAERSAEHF